MTPPKSLIERYATPRELPVPVKKEPSELAAVLTQVRQVGAAIVEALNKDERDAPTPIIQVAAPVVHIDATQMRSTPRHWRLEVTERDKPYGRIKSISIEAID